MRRPKPLNQSGFTIVEFLIATVVFSLVLLVCAFAIIHVGRVYYKGVIMSRTQDLSRRTGEDVTQAIQFGTGGEVLTGGPQTQGNGYVAQSYCVGTIRYTYSKSGPKTDDQHVLWKDRVGAGYAGCEPCNLSAAMPTCTDSVGSGEALAGNNVRIPEFVVTKSGDIYTIRLFVSYGETEDLFETGTNFTVCKGVNASGQFCATSLYETSVTNRLL